MVDAKIKIQKICQIVLFSAIFGYLSPSAHAVSPTSTDSRVLKSASELDYPPFAVILPDGSADGFSVELLKAVAQIMGVRLDVAVGPWHEIRQKLERGELDVLPLVSYSRVQHAQKLESLGVLAHDFNNILMAIIGNADLALESISPLSPVLDHIREINKSACRAAELSKQMLAYSGRGKFVIEPIGINGLVTEMNQMLKVTSSKKVVLKFNFADHLPIFDGDPTQVRQVIMNLIMNASEAVGDESGEVMISTGVIDCDRTYLDTTNIAARAGLDKQLPEGLYIHFEVSDTGCGMSDETQTKIFDPFFTTKFTGRGLGMAAMLGIVRGHKGTIKIFSELNKGNTIRVLFPASVADLKRNDRFRDKNTEASVFCDDRGKSFIFITATTDNKAKLLILIAIVSKYFFMYP